MKITSSLFNQDSSPSPRFRFVREFLDRRRQDMAAMMDVVRAIIKRKRLDRRQRSILWYQVTPLAVIPLLLFLAAGGYVWLNWTVWFPEPTAQTASVAPAPERAAALAQQTPNRLSSQPQPGPVKSDESSPVEPPVVNASVVSDTCPKTYVVRKGDNLWKISLLFWGSGFLNTEIVEANSTISNPDLIFIGQRLAIPCVDQPTMTTAQKLQAKAEQLEKKARKNRQRSVNATAAKISLRTNLSVATSPKAFAPSKLVLPLASITIDFVDLPGISLVFSKAENTQEIADTSPV